MRRLLCFSLTVALLAALSGCVQLSKESLVINRSATRGLTQDRTMTESYTEQMHRINSVIDHDAAALVEDIDLLWQRDRVARLTRWHTH